MEAFVHDAARFGGICGTNVTGCRSSGASQCLGAGRGRRWTASREQVFQSYGFHVGRVIGGGISFCTSLEFALFSFALCKRVEREGWAQPASWGTANAHHADDSSSHWTFWLLASCVGLNFTTL